MNERQDRYAELLSELQALYAPDDFLEVFTLTTYLSEGRTRPPTLYELEQAVIATRHFMGAMKGEKGKGSRARVEAASDAARRETAALAGTWGAMARPDRTDGPHG